jgi:hypothetical protein
MPRLNSKEERGELLIALTNALIRNECKDLEILTLVDQLCRRTWSDIGRGWVIWAYYMENFLGDGYDEWAKANWLKI